jgi:threonine/homoserine/homoserine lactone efflux protein
MIIPPFDVIVSLFAFVFVMAITPGPNNVIALSSGATFGFRATTPFMFGVCCGFPVMLLAAALGLGGLLQTIPWLYPAVKMAGVLYLLWLAWKIATASTLGLDADAASKPLTMWQACVFQWVNPKAWILALGGVATYAAPDRFWPTVAVFAVAFIVTCWPSLAVWAGFGVLVRRVLDTPARIRAFNLAMATLLVASLWAVVRDGIDKF